MASSDQSGHQTADNLLRYLHSELDDAGVRYREPLAPLSGGYETRMYRFQLHGAPAELSRPLVLRVFPARESPGRAIWESAVQNALSDQRFPVARVHLTGTNPAVLGGPFMVMDFLPGETMLVAEPERLPILLGTTHASLHNLSPEPLTVALHERGIEEQRYRLGPRLDRLSGRRTDYPWLEEAIQWLLDNRPPEPEQLSICHGDFHPLNILVQDGKVSAVLDWPGFAIADAVMDVGFTVVLMNIAARVVVPVENLEMGLERYFDAYHTVRPLNLAHLDYYSILRCVMALIEGYEGQKVWSYPTVLDSLVEWVYEGAGIRVDVPR